MAKKREKRIFYEEVASGLGVSESTYETHPKYALYRYTGKDRLAIWPRDQRSSAIVAWLEEQAREFGADETALVLLANGRRLIEGDHVAYPEQFDECLTEACRLIQSKIDENVGPLMQHGQKFKESRRGKEKSTQWLDEGLKQVLQDVGPNASFKEVIDEIERLTRVFHYIFQEVDRKDSTVSFKNPKRRDGEKSRTFKTVQNRIIELKKSLFNQ